jgi:radical SAM protein with 4Fe4S-binding SPASM domain
MLAERRARYEPFGGIVQLENPPALAFVDQQLMRELGYPDSPLWQTRSDRLSAPVEVHFNVTARCTLACRHCTSDAGEGEELDTARIERAIDVLAGAGVFHVAFGGGELFLRDDALALAAHARSRGLVPNATTNGHCLTEELARGCTVFGQVNVSLDGVGAAYRSVRQSGEFEQADRALRWLLAAGVHTGINCVVSQKSFDGLEEVVAYADRIGVEEVLFLRVKPSGRARLCYHELRMTPEQGQAFFPLLRRLGRRYRSRLQTDCSLVPHICSHRPSKRAMELLGVEGCSAGNLLLGVRADGRIVGCSHVPGGFGDVCSLVELWPSHPGLEALRGRAVTDPSCTACRYFSVCRGGCPLFSDFLVGDAAAADPECPRLLAHRVDSAARQG